ncbi:hypothetical protein M440DRAFT_1329089, partial [Trichoderma longibrachiatum ATCC 18648]
RRKKRKTYNSRCSPVVTHLTTNLPLIGLTLGEQTGSRILQWIWSYVVEGLLQQHHEAPSGGPEILVAQISNMRYSNQQAILISVGSRQTLFRKFKRNDGRFLLAVMGTQQPNTVGTRLRS